MSNQNIIIPEKIHLNEIRFVKDEMKTLDEKFSKRPSYDIIVAHNMMHNLEKQVVKIGLFIELIGEIDSVKIEQGGNYNIDFIFTIDDMKDYYEMIGNSVVFSGSFVSTLLGISYSTARGMLLQKWIGTFLDNVILPVISVPKLLESKR